MEENLKIESVWPEPFVEYFDDEWPVLNNKESDANIERWTLDNKKLLLRVVTWNLCAKPPPSIEYLNAKLLPKDRFHVYIIGTEECERSIAQSAINPSKKKWESILSQAIGIVGSDPTDSGQYIPVRSHTLQAIHIMAFVHKAIAHQCSVVTSAAVATGAGNTLGNKGGVAIYLKIGNTKILVVNAHLAAHQNAETQRNADYWKICTGIPLLIDKKQETRQKGNKIHPTGDSGIISNHADNVETSVAANEVISNELGETTNSSLGVSATELQNQITSDTTLLVVMSEDVKTQQQLLNEIQQQSSNTVIPSAPAEEVNNVASIAIPSTTLDTEDDADDGEEDGDEVVGIAENSLPVSPIPIAEANKRTDSHKSVVPSAAVLQQSSGERGLPDCADVVIFMGDLNYRIKGNRSAISGSLAANMHDVLLHNDQLRSNMSRSLVLQHFAEPPLHFRPTYKLDVGSIDSYDTGTKKRIPAWTDRILFVPRPEYVQCIAYDSDVNITTSDHKPVYASFIVNVSSYVSLDKNNNIVDTKLLAPEFTSESQVCSIM